MIDGFLGVINQGCKGAAFVFIKRVTEKRINMFADRAAAISEYMGKLFIFSVDVGNKKLCWLRESQLFTFGDDLHCCFLWSSE